MDVGSVWWFWFTTNAFAVDKRLRRIMRLLPRDPRCKFCNTPFQGIGGAIARLLFRKQQSSLNPRYCNLCELASSEFPGGAEVEMAILFVDIRGSTALSEGLTPTEFNKVIDRFYRATTRIIIDADGLVEKLAGDAVAAFWGAGFAGPDYVRRTVEVARKILHEMDRQSIPVGAGVHHGVGFFGALGTPEGLTEFTASGEEVNTAARLASHAAAGELIVSEQALEAAGLEKDALEARSLELKGISEPVRVRVMHAA
jgi:adenylate cyclase